MSTKTRDDAAVANLNEHVRACPTCRAHVKGQRHSLCHEGTRLYRIASGDRA